MGLRWFQERMKTLKEMQRRLDTSVNFVTPTGELIKEGKIKAISSQTNKKADRYMFLVSNLIRQNRDSSYMVKQT